MAGGVHNQACTNYWYETTEGVTSYTEEYTRNHNENQSSDFIEEKYCYGKSSMFMQGFEWEGTTCVVYLFSSWVVTTRAALIGACFGTVAFGILVEFIIRKRRTTLAKLEKGMIKMAWSASLYAAQLTSSYLVMLIVMTYSGPLFISVIAGLVLGHVMFNWEDVVGEKGSGEVNLEGSTPCCQNTLDDDVFSDNGRKSVDTSNAKSKHSESSITEKDDCEC